MSIVGPYAAMPPAAAQPRSRGRRLRLPSALSRIGWIDRAGVAVLLLLVLAALLAPLLAPHDPTLAAGEAFTAPEGHHLLGTDDLGRDILSRVLFGIRASLLSAVLVIGSGVLFGGLVGLVAGVRGGLVDTLLMRFTDVFLAMPGPVLAIAVVAALGPSLVHTLLAVAVVWWPWYARLVRAETRALVTRPFVDAARLGGAGRWRIMLRHLLPGTVGPVIVTASLDVQNVVLTLAGLSFLGLGAPDPAPELGSMVAKGQDYFFGHPWIPLIPAAAVFLLAAAANLCGDAIRDLQARRP
jgi:peptide/nickel transport system permease protein